ncbi:MAG: GH3 auxin-responsive promoter family protein [Bacteroidota bacterium]
MPILASIIKKGIELRHKIRLSERTPSFYQRKELKKLLRKSQYTLFGQTYQFTNILSSRNFVNKFRATVPVHDYNRIYASWWNKCLHNAVDVTWPGKVKYFALSSGTSESSSKHIPVTNDMVKSIQRTSIRQIISLGGYQGLPADLFSKGILMLGGSTHLHQQGSYFEGDLSGITASKIPFWFQHFYKPGKQIAKEKDLNTKLDEIVSNAPQWDIGILVGVPAWCQLLIEKIIAQYNLNTIHDLWPNLTIYVHGGVSFEPYRKSFERLVARPLTYIETYLASEGFNAYQDEQDNRSMKLVLNKGLFFEFVPFNEENFNGYGELVRKPKTLLNDEVKAGEEYALLLSTCSGAWRYLIGDVIRFTDTVKAEIVITGRTKHFLSLCGEHLSVDNMNKAVELVSDTLNITINEFCVAGISHGSLFAHKWYIGTDDNVDPELLRKHLDDHLKILNDDYRVERGSALKEILVEVLPLHVFMNWMEKRGKIGGQNKFPRVMKNAAFEEWEDFVRAEHA